MSEAAPTTAAAPPGAASPRRRERRAPQAAVRQVPFARAFNRYRPIEVLSADQIETIHRTALKLLRDTGIEVMQGPARAILKAAGAEVDEATQRVRFDPALIEDNVAKAPRRFAMQARNRAYDVGCGEGEIVFAATGGPAFAHDCDRGKRPGNFADMCDYLKLVHRLNVVHQEGGCPIEPTDLPADSRHLDFYQAALTLTDKTWQCWALGEYRVEDAVNMAGIAYGLGRAEMKAIPVTLTIINSNSPLRLDIPMCEALLAMGRAGQPVAMTPFTLSGAMSPVTLAGALVQQHAEALAMLALSQIAAPGA
ncbi:MAG TPA: trimethylamine methyltransferase family protein, partial [Dongiaceae bacterium]|nr:trimethylamine methyltransferase family protein [Dongiaceae bacterium]